MAPSQMEHQQEQTLGHGYTHKKFNCGYSHKKLGLRLRKREQENEGKTLTSPKIQEEVKTIKPYKDLFRPYALDENNTPRKRKISRSLETLEESDTTPVSVSNGSSTALNLQYRPHQQQNLTVNISCPTATPMESSNYSALSPNSYNIRLQRQRVALYMRYLAQLQQKNTSAFLQTGTGYPMGYPNVTAPLFNSC